MAIVGGGGEEKTSTPASTLPVERASDVAVASGALWVTRIEDNAVAQLDQRTLKPTGQRVRVGRSPYDIASGFGELWVADYRSDSVSRIDPRTVKAKGPPIPTGRGPFGVAVGYGAVWVTNEVDRNLVEIDPGTNRVRRKITVGPGPHGVAVGEGAVWVAGAASSSVVRVDPRSGAKRRIPMPDLCQDVAVGGGSVWAVLPQVHSVVRIDPARGRRAGGLISVGLGPREHRLRPRLGLGRERHRRNRDADRCSHGPRGRPRAPRRRQAQRHRGERPVRLCPACGRRRPPAQRARSRRGSAQRDDPGEDHLVELLRLLLGLEREGLFLIAGLHRRPVRDGRIDRPESASTCSVTEARPARPGAVDCGSRAAMANPFCGDGGGRCKGRPNGAIRNSRTSRRPADTERHRGVVQGSSLDSSLESTGGGQLVDRHQGFRRSSGARALPHGRRGRGGGNNNDNNASTTDTTTSTSTTETTMTPAAAAAPALSRSTRIRAAR